MESLKPYTRNFLSWTMPSDVRLFLSDWKELNSQDLNARKIVEKIIQDKNSSKEDKNLPTSKLLLQESVVSWLNDSYLDQLIEESINYSIKRREEIQPGLKDQILSDEDFLNSVCSNVQYEIVSPFLEQCGKEIVNEWFKPEPMSTSEPLLNKEPSGIQNLVYTIRHLSSKIF